MRASVKATAPMREQSPPALQAPPQPQAPIASPPQDEGGPPADSEATSHGNDAAEPPKSLKWLDREVRAGRADRQELGVGIEGAGGERPFKSDAYLASYSRRERCVAALLPEASFTCIGTVAEWSVDHTAVAEWSVDHTAHKWAAWPRLSCMLPSCYVWASYLALGAIDTVTLALGHSDAFLEYIFSPVGRRHVRYLTSWHF